MTWVNKSEKSCHCYFFSVFFFFNVLFILNFLFCIGVEPVNNAGIVSGEE